MSTSENSYIIYYLILFKNNSPTNICFFTNDNNRSVKMYLKIIILGCFSVCYIFALLTVVVSTFYCHKIGSFA